MAMKRTLGCWKAWGCAQLNKSARLNKMSKWFFIRLLRVTILVLLKIPKEKYFHFLEYCNPLGVEDLYKTNKLKVITILKKESKTYLAILSKKEWPMSKSLFRITTLFLLVISLSFTTHKYYLSLNANQLTIQELFMPIFKLP